MKFSATAITLLSIVASTVAAPAVAPAASHANGATSYVRGQFKHDKNTRPGIYGHRVGLDGTAHTTYLGSHDDFAHHSTNRTSIPAKHSPGDKRGGEIPGPRGAVCQTLRIVESDLDAAVQNLAAQMGTSLRWYHAISSVHGNAVAYGCDYGNGQTISGAEMQGYINNIASACGAGQKGYYCLPEVRGSYGVTVAGDPFC